MTDFPPRWTIKNELDRAEVEYLKAVIDSLMEVGGRDIKRLEAEIELLKDEAAINETVIHGLQANRDDAEAEIERLRAQIAQDVTAMKKAAAETARLEAEIERLQGELEQANLVIVRLTCQEQFR